MKQMFSVFAMSHSPDVHTSFLSENLMTRVKYAIKKFAADIRFYSFTFFLSFTVNLLVDSSYLLTESLISAAVAIRLSKCALCSRGAIEGKELLRRSCWIFENILEALFPSFGEAQADKRKHSGGLKCSECISIKPLEFLPSTFFKHSQ